MNSSIKRQEEKKEELKVLVDEILPVERELAIYFKLETFSPKYIVDFVDPPLKDDLSAQLEKLERLLSQLMELEEKNEHMLEEKMGGVKERLSSLKREKLLRETYSKREGSQALYIDKNL